MWTDLRYSFRRLIQDRSFTALALIALSIGIGATTAIYSLIHGVILNPFPYPGSDRLMTVGVIEVGHNGGRNAFTAAETLELRANTQDIFEDIVSANQKQVVVTANGMAPVRLLSAEVSSNTFPFFGMSAIEGRVITEADARGDAANVVVLNYKTWLRDFGADPGVIGRHVQLDGKPFEIIGVMPSRFAWQGAALWTPLEIEPSTKADQKFCFMLGRLKVGVSTQAAEAALTPRFTALSKTYPLFYPPKWRVELKSLADLVIGQLRQMLLLLSAAVGLLLLIACGNVATLLLARATAREKEISVRMAMGASRPRLVRQMMIESLLLSIAGAVLGIGLAFIAIGGLVALAPAQAIPAEAEVALNIPVLLFTIAATVLTAFLFGLAPALHASRKDLQDGLRDTGKGSSGGFRYKGLRGGLVVAEVALSLVLLIGSGLFMRSFLALTQVKLGFNPENLIGMSIPISEKRYNTKEKKAAYLKSISSQIATIPGVRSVSIHTGLPPYGGGGMAIDILGKDDASRSPSIQLSDDRILETLGVRLLLGRRFNEDDMRAGRPVALVNESFVESYRAGIGSRVKLKQIVDLPVFEVVGVFADIKNNGLEGRTSPEMFLPHTVTALGGRGVLIRTSTNADSMVKAVQKAVWAVDPDQPVSEIKTLRQYMHENSFTMPEFGLTLLGAFAFAGLTLMSIGVYSLLSYAVSRSSHEIGIRMALGAQAGEILGRTLASGMRLVGVGAAIGLALGFAAAQALKSLLFGVGTVDAVTAAGACVLLTAIGALACLIPARRASRIDPIEALRSQ